VTSAVILLPSITTLITFSLKILRTLESINLTKRLSVAEFNGVVVYCLITSMWSNFCNLLFISEIENKPVNGIKRCFIFSYRY